MFFLSRYLSKLGYDPKKYYFQQCQRNRLTRNIYVLLPFRNRIHKIYTRKFKFGIKPTTYT